MQVSELKAGAESMHGGHEPAGPPSLWIRMTRRRKFVVDWPFQFRKSLFGLCLTLVLLFLLNLSVNVINKMSTDAFLVTHPEMRSSLEEKDRMQGRLLLVGSLVFAAGVFCLGLMQSHKTAGAAFHLRRCLGRIREGRFDTRAKLRCDDDLQDLAAAFNEMAQALEDRSRSDMELLQAVLGEHDEAGQGAGDREVRARLRRMIEERNRRLAS